MPKHLLSLTVFCLLFFQTHAQLVINEVSQGPSGSKEYVELLVVGTPTCDSSCVDIRGWIIDDNNGTFAAGSGRGIASGCMRFANVPQWECIPMGTLIVVYNFGDRNAAIPPDDPTDANGDCVYVLPDWSLLFEVSTSQPNTTNPLYTGLSFSAAGNWSTQSMNNTGDSYQTRDPNNLGVPHHAVSWGNNSSNNIIYFAGSAGQTSFFMANTVNDDPYAQANWVSGSIPGSETPGAANNPANAAWIATMNNYCQPFAGFDSTSVDTSFCNGDSIFLAGEWINSPGTYIDSFISSGGCDSLIFYQVQSYSSYSFTQFVEICAGDSFFAGGSWQSNSGVFIDNFTSNAGCDSVIQTNLTVLNTTFDSSSFSGCQGDTFLIFGSQIFTPGVYLDTLSGSSGCDSVIYVAEVSIYPLFSDSVTAQICFGDSLLIGGEYRSTTGIYFDSLSSINGCDSIIRVDLTVGSINLASTNFNICQGDSLFAGGQWRFISGTYYDTVSSAGGCDSVHASILTVNIPVLNTSNVAICMGDSLFAGGAWQTSPGLYYDTLIGSNNCDSVQETNLSVIMPVGSNRNIGICDGDSVFIGGAWQFNPGTFFDTFTAASGCDSIVQTQLTVFLPSFDTSSLSICQGDSIFLGGIWRQTSGSYTDTFTGSNSCDSFHTTSLSVILPVQSSQNLDICQGDSIFLSGAWQTTSGTYNDTLLAASGCDSIVTTQLTVISPIIQNQSQTICQGDSAFLAGAWRFSSGIYNDSFTAVSGCDSIISHQLTVIPSASGQDQQSICRGDSIFLGGAWQTSAGTYFDTLISSSGCDSILQTILSVRNPRNGTVNVSICDGDRYFAGGAFQTTAGTYLDTFTASNGCDSFHTTNLTVRQNPIVFPNSPTRNVCAGDSILLQGPSTPPNLTYQWSNGATSRGIWVTPTSTIVYGLTVTDAFGCEGDGIVTLVPFSFDITADATPDTVLYGGDAILSAGGDPAQSYSWFPYDFLDNAFEQTTNALGMTGTTTYTLTGVSDSGCVDEDTVRVVVIQPDQLFVVPSGFSPNDDGVNDIYRVLNPEQWDIQQFQIWNRWGELVYDSTRDNPLGWDGKYKNKEQPIAVYAYYVVGRSLIDGREYQQEGTVTLVR